MASMEFSAGRNKRDKNRSKIATHHRVCVCVCVCIHIESSNYTVCVNYTHTLLANSISVLDMNEYVCKLY